MGSERGTVLKRRRHRASSCAPTTEDVAGLAAKPRNNLPSYIMPYLGNSHLCAYAKIFFCLPFNLFVRKINENYVFLLLFYVLCVLLNESSDERSK